MSAQARPPDPAIIRAMDRALELGASARRRAAPNPGVGCVIVDGADPDTVLGEGATAEPGADHAEVAALRAAGSSAEGATAVVTLEPCAHTGRTGPCTEMLIAAGIRRVVAALEDPDPQVQGRGFAKLRQAGLEVEVGLGAAAATTQLRAYIHHRRTGRPFVVLKLAQTLDGRTAAADGSSRWITGPEARADAHRLRADSDAVVVGAGTIREDDPALDVRHADGPDPLRVVLGTAPADARARPLLELSGEPADVLAALVAKGVLQVLIEGGAAVAGQFHRSGLVDQYVFYVAPVLMGGEDGIPVLRGPGVAAISDAWRGRITAVHRLGADLRIDLEPNGETEA